MNKDIQPAIDLLRTKYTSDNPATIEDLATACGIDLAAPFSYREVLDLHEALRISPYVTRFWIDGERRYFATTPAPEWRPPSVETLKDRGAWP